MPDLQRQSEEGQPATLIRGSVTGFEQVVAALAGLLTAGPLGALASWGTIRGVQGKWAPWFVLGVPAAIAINGFYFGLFYAYTAINQKLEHTKEQTKEVSTPTINPLTSSKPQPRPEQGAGGIYQAGIAVGGQNVSVDLSTIRQLSNPSEREFTYYLGSEKIISIANCPARTWTTMPEGATHQPKSTATANMLNRVCQSDTSNGPTISSSGAGIVFDPPSNIRSTPNGSILCSVTSRGAIPIQGRQGDWYQTDYCGSPGFIHKEQIRF